MQNALIICYLFLGGVGAGAFLVLSCISWFSPKRFITDHSRRYLAADTLYQKLIGPGYVVATIVQLVAVLCLVFDMGRPERILILVIEPSFTVVSVGAYALAVLLFCSTLLSLFWMGGFRVRFSLIVVLGIFGVVASCVVMVYTGLLLQSFRTVAFWDSLLIPLLFTLSAVSGGIALMVIVMFITGSSLTFASLCRRLSVSDMVLLILELLCLSALLFFSYQNPMSSASVESLLSGSLAQLFWFGLVVCGIVVPLVLSAIQLQKSGGALVVIPSVLVLVGGLCLRMCIVGAGY